MWKQNISSLFTYFSVILVLTLLGIYGLISLHTGNMTNILKENLNVIVELEPQTLPAEVDQLLEQINGLESIKTETVRYINAAEALDIMQTEMGEAVLVEGEENPFRETIVFNVQHQYVDTTSLNKIIVALEKEEHVQSVQYYKGVYAYLGDGVKRVNRLLLFLGLILTVFAFALIYSTIQLNLYADRFKIRTMELVGADWSQIRKPFIVKALKLSLFSVGITLAILLVLLLILSFQFKHFLDIIHYGYVALIFVLITIFGFAITQFASYLVVERYLGAEKSKFY